ncbi:serine protease Do-like HtrB [Ruminiclostridium hungatei]|uniref:Serine protease Do-like HtrB n=1 Tax=Ruminiclostridium hungatei TaxID=48256 RepID=A0A1V4SNX3_RUMHU|nr:trypsin-like peptidase domain-containing protein [Ruminiclostridium hungatei]OPX45560.1 serine protease Do-like HtrB [Ruminiclostridium hungatei]
MNNNGYNNEDWNYQGQHDYNYDNHTYSNNEIITVPRKKRGGKLITYLSLVLVTSLVTSFAVGGAMYSSFSRQLDTQVSALKQTSALNTALNDGVSSTKLSIATTDQLKVTNLFNESTGNLSVAQIAKKVGPSIVGIKMSVQSTRQSAFYGSRSSTSDSEGSGIIFTQDGYIITNYHVVQYADPKNGAASTTLTVYLPDKREAKATFVGGDSENDLAVIKINLSDLPAAELGDSSEVEVGDPAVAIGNPLGMEFAGSVTYGVISALNRQLDTGDNSMSLIQTDAAINPGNSGGALVNSKGQVIGINSAKISVAGVEGLGFAIPMNTAKPIVDQLKDYGYVKGKPLIGISAQEVTEDISRMYGLPVGVYISEVTPGGAAQTAGMKKGDVLLSLDGTKIKTMSDLDAVKKKHKAGDTVKAVVSRAGTEVSMNITFTEAK